MLLLALGVALAARGGGEGGEGGGGRGTGGYRGYHGSGGGGVHSLGPYPFLTLAVIVAVVGGYLVYLRSRR